MYARKLRKSWRCGIISLTGKYFTCGVIYAQIFVVQKRYNIRIMIKVTTLFSGSKGNCTLVQTENCNVLLDIGYRYKSIVDELLQLGVNPCNIDAIIISHEHNDHIGGLTLWSKYYNTPLYVPKVIANTVANKSYCTDVYPVDGAFDICDLHIDVYNCSHDSAWCCGYRFGCNGEYVASVTDTGTFGDELVDFLSPCKTVVVESNHDVNMLRNGHYPYPLKQRILSDYGHLSNNQTATLLQKLNYSVTKNIVLAHLSENNNTKELAFASAVEALKQVNIVEGKDVHVYVADQYSRGKTID